MPNQEHVDILKQGVDIWNEWRKENPNIHPNLEQAILPGANLKGANLEGANLKRTRLEGAELLKANLQGADCEGANLERANLEGVSLRRAYLNRTNLKGAYLRVAKLQGVQLQGANLEGANLMGAKFDGANLEGVNLEGANLESARLWKATLNNIDFKGTQFKRAFFSSTIIVNVDLSKARGLSLCRHRGGSSLSSDTLIQSKGKIPITFLRGCGLSDWEIESSKLYKEGLSNFEINDIIYKVFDIRSTQAIQINPLFISYNSLDETFVDQIGKALTKKGVRFWQDIHHGTAGRLEKQIDRAMQYNDIALLVLSKNSVKSDWVEWEVRKARDIEKEKGKDIICPISLDDSWKTCKWPERLKAQIMEYNILDFSDWKNPASFQKQFSKLLQGLDLFYQ